VISPPSTPGCHGAPFVGDELCTRNPLTGRRGPGLMPKQLDVSVAQCADSLALLEPLQATMILPGYGDPWAGSPTQAVAHARQER
jgi:hypothetical protein